MTRILGIDPGSRKTGWALLLARGRELEVRQSGTIRLSDRMDLAQRLGQLSHEIEAIVEEGSPECVAVEDIFSHRNARSALALGQARGAAIAVAGRRSLPVVTYPPASVKQAVCGHGRADKPQVQRMVQVLLSLTDVPQEDEADAMAIAICHALRSRGDALRAATPAPRKSRGAVPPVIAAAQREFAKRGRGR